MSYSHQDEAVRDQVLRFLKPLERAGLMDVWVDTRLSGGDLWQREIEESLASATVALLLISQDFLVSDFIVGQEVPPLLEKAVAGGLILIPVFLSPSSVCEVDFSLSGPQGKIRLAEFQGVASPGKTLKEMSRVERERKLSELAARLKRLAEIPTSPGPPILATAPLPASSKPGTVTLREAFGKVARERPLGTAVALAGLLAGIPLVLSALGYFALRAREDLLGLEPLDYPKTQWIATGADALWSLPRRGLWSLDAEFPVVRHGAWALLALTLALLAVRFLLWRQNAVRIALLSLVAVLLSFGGAFYTVAIRSKPPCLDLKKSISAKSDRKKPATAELAAFETCTWLMNDGERSHQRRMDLDGLLAWLLAAGGVAVWVAARPSGITPPWAARSGRGLKVFHLGLTVFFFLPLLPRAYAVGEWGLTYPIVKTLAHGPTCQPELALALKDGSCCAVDVTQGATEKRLYVNGLRCQLRNTFVAVGRECIESRPGSEGTVSKRAIHNGC